MKTIPSLCSSRSRQSKNVIILDDDVYGHIIDGFVYDGDLQAEISKIL